LIAVVVTQKEKMAMGPGMLNIKELVSAIAEENKGPEEAHMN